MTEVILIFFRNKVLKKLRKAKADFFLTIIDKAGGHSKLIWDQLKTLTGNQHRERKQFSRTRLDRMPVTSASVSMEIPVKWPSFTTPASMNAFFRVAEEKRVPERKPVSNSGSSNSHIPGRGSGGLVKLRIFQAPPPPQAGTGPMLAPSDDPTRRNPRGAAAVVS